MWHGSRWSEGDRAAWVCAGPLRPSPSARGPEAEMLGRGAPTSPGLFTNTAHPIARPTARNRAIAHTTVPSRTGRSRPDHHAPDIHAAGTERAARTPGRELLDVLTDDHSSGPRRKRPQFGITKDPILASDADGSRPGTSAVSRATGGKPRGPRAAAWLLSTRAGVLPQILFGREQRPRTRPDPELSGFLPNERQGTQAGRHQPGPRPRVGGRPPATIRPWPGRRTRPTPRPHNAAPQPNSCAARSPTTLTIPNWSTS